LEGNKEGKAKQGGVTDFRWKGKKLGCSQKVEINSLEICIGRGKKMNIF
jgi:hypothetical protein